MKHLPSLGQGSLNQGQQPSRRNQATSQSDQSGSLSDNFSQAKAHKQTSRKRQPARHTIPPQLRVEILRRDNFRCCFCGASAQTGAQLEIDHRVPISRGGTNDPHNLQTLCQACNLGKSNQLV